MKSLILTCEHGGNEIPGNYQSLFEGAKDILETHWGWDIGALAVAKLFSNQSNVPLLYSTTSRLLVELNRSLHHPALFSAYTKSLSSNQKQAILERFYHPYRNQVEESIREVIQQKKEVLHIAVHSFTPVLNEVVRNADIGLLYDPASENEKSFCKRWKEQIMAISPYKVRFNYPYKGTADGFPTYLRKQFPHNYSGIELEINQQLLKEKASIEEVSLVLIKALKESIL